MAASPFPSDEQIVLGSVLDGRYRIDAVLGTGGMGRVYRAEHTKIGKMVAIKVLHADLGRNREASQRFQREAIASGRLDHPNIVGVSDFGVLDGGACYLVMEILEGESLGDRLARDSRIHWVEAIDILRGVLFGLRHAHERGVVHRDIKPDNIFLAQKDGDPVIKILDFGIAKLYAGSAADPASTRAGLTVGTPAYLSPEQAVGGEITPASDLYSASIVLYEMLAGRAPFEDRDPLAMLGAHVGRRPPAFGVVAPGVDIPPPLEDIVQRGLVKSPAERIGTADDYLAMLDAFSPPLHPPPRRATAQVNVPPGEWNGTTPAHLATPVPGMMPARLATPVPGALPVADATPVLGTMPPRLATPVPGTMPARLATPVPGTMMAATPPPGTMGSLPAASSSLEVTPMPRASRMVSLADVSEPIPLTWIVRSGVLVGLVIVGAIVLAIATHCGGATPNPIPKPPAGSASPPVVPSATGSAKPAAGTEKPAAGTEKPAAGTEKPAAGTEKPAAGTEKPAAGTEKPAAGTEKPAAGAEKPAAGAEKPAAGTEKPAAGTGKPAAATGKPAAGTGKPAAGTGKPADHDAQLKALLHDLESGKTCAERKAAIAKLVELHDAHAVQPLKNARVRPGVGNNSNACLKADAERAIKELGSPPK
jgi:hypothetical protein